MLNYTKDAFAESHLNERRNSIVVSSKENQLSTAIWFPLSLDHMLHLIEYNVFRGLTENKNMIGHRTVRYGTPEPLPENFIDHRTFPNHSVILPLEPDFSDSLTPTTVQMNIVHSSWIDVMPCPTMRNNLIQREHEFSHTDFVKDLVGTLIDPKKFTRTASPLALAWAGEPKRPQVKDCKCHTAETGLIVWGEPYLVNSWEVTTKFMDKWGWALAGCDELIDSTNLWRGLRGEPPLLLPTVS